MFSKSDIKQILRRSAVALALLVALIGIGLLLNAVAQMRDQAPFALASDLPRGALVYAQFSDLPAMLKKWDESELKSRYLVSTSFEQLQTRHLALKLVSRWEEFSDATGFPIDTGVLSGIADNRAAIAIYDIGRLDLALIAPLNAEKLAASHFFQGKDHFKQIALPDGAVYYLHDVEADKGRQKQQIGFAVVKGKFVLTTDEKLLLRAIANLNGGDKKDRMTDEPAFQTLSSAVTPHNATVWVDQSKLNEDWYFKQYWLMSKVADLKNIRAGIFDLELQEGKWVERREFLTNDNRVQPGAAIPTQIQQQVAGIVPADVPFVQLGASGARAAELVAGALYDVEEKGEGRRRGWRWDYYGPSDFEVSSEEEEGFSGYSRYSYLSHNYNQFVDDPDDAGESGEEDVAAPKVIREKKTLASLHAALQSASPIAVAKLAKPRAIEGPLFAEFGRAAVVVLRNPAGLNTQALEQAIAQTAANRLMIAGATARFEWNNQNRDGAAWRVMPLPALGRSIGYGLRGQMLIVSNSPDLLATLMTRREQSNALAASSPVNELTVIRSSDRAEAFDRIFAKLDEPRVKAYWKERKGDEAKPTDPSKEFFSGNIASLLDVASPVEEMRIERSYANGRMREEVAMTLK